MVAAVAALVVATTGGGFAWHHRQLQEAHGVPGDLPVGIASISVTGTGEIFKVLSNQGCTSPCSTVWKNDGSSWEKLATLQGSPQSPTDQVIRRIVMAPDGRNGWAWGESLYATLDGGATWSPITSGPWNRPYGIEDLDVGRTQVWVTAQTMATGRTLWHAPVGSDDWSQVHPPLVTMPGAGKVAPQHWMINSVLPDGRVDLLLGPFPHGVYDTVGGEYGWIRQTVRCSPLPPLLGGRVQAHRICGPLSYEAGRGGYSVPLKYSEVQVAVHAGTSSTPVGDADILYATDDRAVIATHSGIIPSDLRLGKDWRVEESSDTGDHVAFFTGEGRIFLSNDSGRHWIQMK
jgi:hypothetical protein